MRHVGRAYYFAWRHAASVWKLPCMVQGTFRMYCFLKVVHSDRRMCQSFLKVVGFTCFCLYKICPTNSTSLSLLPPGDWQHLFERKVAFLKGWFLLKRKTVLFLLWNAVPFESPTFLSWVSSMCTYTCMYIYIYTYNCIMYMYIYIYIYTVIYSIVIYTCMYILRPCLCLHYTYMILYGKDISGIHHAPPCSFQGWTNCCWCSGKHSGPALRTGRGLVSGGAVLQGSLDRALKIAFSCQLAEFYGL